MKYPKNGMYPANDVLQSQLYMGSSSTGPHGLLHLFTYYDIRTKIVSFDIL